MPPSIIFPPVETARTNPNGLLAVGGDLSVDTLLEAYRQGIFPWFSPGQPIYWWSPSQRMVLKPSEIHISKSLKKTQRKTPFTITWNQQFEAVIRNCAMPRKDGGGTWITEAMIEAYCELHRAGWAHSVEVWLDEALVGGLYGVGFQHVFCGESMFSRVTDASKIAFVELAAECERRGVALIDCQMHTPYLASLGAYPIPRALFIEQITAVNATPWS